MRGVIFARFLASAKFSLCIDYQFYNTDLNCEVLYDGYLFSCVTVGNILLDGLHRRLILNNLTLSVTDDGNYDEGYTKQSLPPSLVPPEVSAQVLTTPLHPHPQKQPHTPQEPPEVRLSLYTPPPPPPPLEPSEVILSPHPMPLVNLFYNKSTPLSIEILLYDQF